MARNKKKTKTVAAEDVESSDGEHETPQTAVEAPTDHNQPASDTESTEKPKKKKEYKGNKLSRGKGKNKEDHETEKLENEEAKVTEQQEEVVVTRQGPVAVLYCPICTFPAEMCEFSGMMDKCRPWLLEHAAELADAEERGRKRRILTEKDRLEALLEGRGIKKALERVVVLDVEKRTGKRMVTSVFGMDLFGFNLKDLSREWRKTFSCGAGVRAAEEGKHQDCIDIQGNVADQLAELLVKKYNIPKEAIFGMDKKKRVPFF